MAALLLFGTKEENTQRLVKCMTRRGFFNERPHRRMAQNDDSELFDYFADAIYKCGAAIDGSVRLGNHQYQRTSIGQHASMETITDNKPSRQVVKLVVDENGYGRVFMRYLGFDHDSLSRVYDEINYQ